MYRAAIRLLTALVVTVTLTATDLTLGQVGWQAGVATVNITPDQPMWMAGYAARNHPARGKLTDLWAKALVLQDDRGSRAVLVTLDLVGIDRRLSQSICRSLHQAYSLERRQIALCVSHTHTGPVVGHNLDPLHYLQLDAPEQQRVDQYAKTLHDKVVDLVGRAIQRCEPAGLSWGTGSATFAVNRRNNPETQVPALRASATLAGPSDHDVPVLAIRRDDGRLAAVLFGYACHATVLDFYQWSGDYPGFAQIELEKTHPGCTAMFWAGCGADQNPLPRRRVELARQYGKRLAEAVNRVLAAPMCRAEGRLTTTYREIDLPYDKLPSPDQIAKNVDSKNKYESARARMLLADFDQHDSLASTYPYPVAVWKVGRQVRLILLSGEVVVDYALRLKAEHGGRRIWVAGYSNDVMAYIPSRRVLREGGYEGAGAMVYYGLPGAWAPDLQRRIVSEVQTQIHAAAARPDG